MNKEETDRLRRYFEHGFRELQLGDIKRANECDVRMGTFQLCAAFIDALSLTYSAHRKPKAKEQKWARFVEDFFPSEYAPLAPMYDGFRNLLLHNFSETGLAFVHQRPDLHLRESDGRTILNRESFVDDVGRAFEDFYAAVLADDELRARALEWLDAHPPIGVWVIEPQKPKPMRPPVGPAIQTHAQSRSASASFSQMPTTIVTDDAKTPEPPPPPPKMATRIKKKPKPS